jgi:hypothetical protein
LDEERLLIHCELRALQAAGMLALRRRASNGRRNPRPGGMPEHKLEEWVERRFDKLDEVSPAWNHSQDETRVTSIMWIIRLDHIAHAKVVHAVRLSARTR